MASDIPHPLVRSQLKLILPPAMKCNPDSELIKQFVALDVGIDCASLGEMECAIGLGALPERIIYTNPIKTPASLESARMLGVKTLVFDNVEELLKIKKWIPDAKLLLRIEADDASAKINFSSKFGASSDSASALIKLASKLDMDVAGICFHIGKKRTSPLHDCLAADDRTCLGTGAKDPRAFSRAVHNAIDIAQRSNLNLRLLDLGGGFSNSNFASFAEHLRTAISYAKHAFPQAQVIAEPGRYLACSSFIICCQVIGRRAEADAPRLYVNDGVYGNFMNAIMEQEKYQAVAIVKCALETGWCLRTWEHTLVPVKRDSMDLMQGGHGHCTLSRTIC
jgi:ornithine decarboxylase